MLRVIKNWKTVKEFSMPIGSFTQNGYGRQYLPIPEIKFRENAFRAFGYETIFDEPIFKNFVGNHYLDGAFVHEHKDTAPDGFMHVRANWMLQKPQSGGNPVLDGEELNVDVGDLWVCYASEELHASTPIHGGQRLVCSFGALIKKPKGFNVKDLFL